MTENSPMRTETERSIYVLGKEKITEQRKVLIDYTNHRGERAVRTILPMAPLTWSSTEWHPEEQWLLEALDVEKDVVRFFAVKDIHGWGVKVGPSGQTIDGMITAQLKRSMERNARMSNRLNKLSAKMTAHDNPEMQDAGDDILVILKDEDPT